MFRSNGSVVQSSRNRMCWINLAILILKDPRFATLQKLYQSKKDKISEAIPGANFSFDSSGLHLSITNKRVNDSSMEVFKDIPLAGLNLKFVDIQTLDWLDTSLIKDIQIQNCESLNNISALKKAPALKNLFLDNTSVKDSDWLISRHC